jgi:hypothetical protein
LGPSGSDKAQCQLGTSGKTKETSSPALVTNGNAPLAKPFRVRPSPNSSSTGLGTRPKAKSADTVNHTFTLRWNPAGLSNVVDDGPETPVAVTSVETYPLARGDLFTVELRADDVGHCSNVAKQVTIGFAVCPSRGLALLCVSSLTTLICFGLPIGRVNQLLDDGRRGHMGMGGNIPPTSVPIEAHVVALNLRLTE